MAYIRLRSSADGLVSVAMGRRVQLGHEIGVPAVDPS